MKIRLKTRFLDIFDIRFKIIFLLVDSEKRECFCFKELKLATSPFLETMSLNFNHNIFPKPSQFFGSNMFLTF